MKKIQNISQLKNYADSIDELSKTRYTEAQILYINESELNLSRRVTKGKSQIRNTAFLNARVLRSRNFSLCCVFYVE
ncbi:hypothetical protein HZS_7034 [Henneguya salminicola]|nr:hypothetical protein HZS_7034 [Henneguya salminicola]